MLVKVKYHGAIPPSSGEPAGHVTVDGIYTVLAFIGNVQMLLIDDNGKAYLTQQAINENVDWTLASVVEGKTQIFP